MKPILVYHRGRHGTLADGRVLAENSLEGFEQAIAEGAEVIELDVWTDMAVAHDPGSEAVPTLPEVLELINGRCKVNVEIKSPKTTPEALDYIGNLFRQGKWKPDQFILSAFHHDSALLCAKTLPEVRVGAIMDCVPTNSYVKSLYQSGIKNLHLHWVNVYMDVEAKYKFKQCYEEHGMELWIWTVNEPEVFQVMCEYGADAVFTDVPDLLAATDI